MNETTKPFWLKLFGFTIHLVVYNHCGEVFAFHYGEKYGLGPGFDIEIWLPFLSVRIWRDNAA